jgi:O-antigen ligase
MVVLWLRSWRLGFVVTLAGGTLLAFVYPVIYSQIYTPIQEYSTVSRFSTWPIMIEMIKASPLIGLGPANYYHYTPLYPLLGFYVKFNSHNNYLDILAQIGLLGMGVFLWLIFEIGRLGWKLRAVVEDGFSRGYVNGALAGLAATLAAGFMVDWFLPFLYNIGIPGFRASVFAWLFLGGLVSLKYITDRSSEVPSQPPVEV